MMELQSTCPTGTGVGAIQWLPIPKKDFVVVDLEQGIYFLRNRFVPDQYAGLSVGKGDGWRRMAWNSTAYMRSDSENSKDEEGLSIEKVKYSLLETVIVGKIKILHEETDKDKTRELQNLNELLLMGFDYYAHDSSCTALAGADHLVNFFLTNPCLCPVIDSNSSPTSPQTDFPKIVDKTRLKCVVLVHRLEDELCPEEVEKLWNSYNKSIKRKTDIDTDDEDYDVEVAPAIKRRPGRPRKQKSKPSFKKKMVKAKSWMSSESSNENDSTDDYEVDEESDEDYVPLGKRRTSKYRLRSRD